jgi:hypothetical protein
MENPKKVSDHSLAVGCGWLYLAAWGKILMGSRVYLEERWVAGENWTHICIPRTTFLQSATKIKGLFSSALFSCFWRCWITYFVVLSAIWSSELFSLYILPHYAYTNSYVVGFLQRQWNGSQVVDIKSSLFVIMDHQIVICEFVLSSSLYIEWYFQTPMASLMATSY